MSMLATLTVHRRPARTPGFCPCLEIIYNGTYSICSLISPASPSFVWVPLIILPRPSRLRVRMLNGISSKLHDVLPRSHGNVTVGAILGNDSRHHNIDFFHNAGLSVIVHHAMFPPRGAHERLCRSVSVTSTEVLRGRWPYYIHKTLILDLIY